jgi:mono/diheme cytochrome c family protein
MTRVPHWAELFFSGSLIMLLGCGGGASFGTAGSGVNVGSGSGGGRGSLSSPGSGSGGAATVGGGNVDPGSGGSTGIVTTGSGGSTTSSPPPATASSDLPCAVSTVLQAHCATCHGSQPKFGAPMSLVTAADFKKMATSGGSTVGQAVIARIQDDAKPMPAAPATRLTSAEISTLTTWINAGAQSSTCQTSVATGGSGGSGSGAGSSSGTTPPTTDPDVTCYDILAHDPSSKTKRFNVPATPDLYHCFNFSPPWGSDKVQMVSWSPVIDNDKVIHHWILYNDTGSVTDGSDMDCSGAHPSAAMVTGWAPGGQPSTLPPDVGQSVAGAGFTLEIHYNNTMGTQADASGVHMCVTKKLRKNEAGIHWLGTENISLPSGGSTSGICVPKATGPVTIISATPHMHLQGRHMTTVINRKGGTTEMLIDKPFEFANQIGYDTPAVIMPGDTLTTTCTYGGAAFYGQGTKQEMCYNFVLAYPNGGLSSGSFLRENGCTGL